MITSTKWCQVQMALSCPPTIPVEFLTLQISSGRAVPYYQSIKRSKLPARTTKPAFDRASEQLLVVAIKALGGVFLQGLTARLRPAPTLTAGCQLRPVRCILMQQDAARQQARAQVCPTSLLMSAVCGLGLRGGTREFGGCSRIRTLDI